MKPFGLNMLSTGGADAAIDQLDSAVALVMDDSGYAARLKQRRPQMTVISRLTVRGEDKLHLNPGDARRRLEQSAMSTSQGVYNDIYCEPTVNGNELQQLVDETLKALAWALPRGIKVAAPHGAFYGVGEDRYAIVDPLVDMIADHPDQFLYTQDEYAAGHMFSGVIDSRYGGETGHIRPETWVASNEPSSWRYWHAGRMTNYFRYRQAKGKKLPKAVASEHGLDALGDVTTWRNTLLRTGGYGDIRGWKSLRAQHLAWYGLKWTPEQAYGEMLKAFYREVYAPWPNILGVCIYCWGSNNDKQWDQFRIDGAGELIATLANYQGASPVTIPHTLIPSTEAVRRTVKPGSATSANVRAEPTTSAAVISTVKADESVLIQIPAAPVNADKYSWVYLPEKKGWVSSVVLFVEDSPVALTLNTEQAAALRQAKALLDGLPL